MSIVKCIKCSRRYDTGTDLEDLPTSISYKVVCPACGQWMRLPETEAIPAPGLPQHLLKEMLAQSRLVGDDEPDTPKKKHTSPKPWWRFW